MVKQLRRYLVVVLVAFAAPLPANAQTTTAPVPAPSTNPITPRSASGQIDGVVVDSLRGGFLAGADIVIEPTTAGEAPADHAFNSKPDSYTSKTDSLGRFRVDKLPPGTHHVIVFHDRLDTLGISLVTKPFRVGPD